ncbi:MAG TPA: glycosyltransferase family 2 protein [Thermoanaerobaculia bacterium]|nr:glycosyltransferase family 2 protein [Thermoanaerobaculia bacterium]
MIVVAWNSAADLASAVTSVPREVPVVVVDNASTDGSADVARAAGARVVALPGNTGFGPACNAGAEAASRELADVQAFLFLNPDAALVDGERALAVLRDELARDPSLGAVAPRLEGKDQDLFQLRKLPTFSSLFREAFLVNRLWPRNPWLRRERYLDRNREEPFDVEQPAGAALLVRRDVFEALGGFDAAFAPAWFEDVDLCARIWQSGRRIRYVPASRATHVGGTTMRRLPYADYLPLYTRNLLRYMARHFGAVSRVASRAVLLLGTLLRLALLPFVKGDHARGDAAQAYLRVTRGLFGFGFESALIDPAGAA